jgi:hypothetical protein
VVGACAEDPSVSGCTPTAAEKLIFTLPESPELASGDCLRAFPQDSFDISHAEYIQDQVNVCRAAHLGVSVECMADHFDETRTPSGAMDFQSSSALWSRCFALDGGMVRDADCVSNCRAVRTRCDRSCTAWFPHGCWDCWSACSQRLGECEYGCLRSQ